MKLAIRWKGTDRQAGLAEHFRRRADFALGRFSDRIRRVAVLFEDLNGPRGGVDKRCVVEVHGPFGVLVAEARDVEFGAAADRALDVSARNVARAVRRISSHPSMSMGGSGPERLS